MANWLERLLHLWHGGADKNQNAAEIVTGSRTLSREEIVGVKAKRLLRTPWKDWGDVQTSRGFVELETGSVFELQCQDSFNPLPIVRVELSEQSLSDDEIELNSEIVHVLASEYWPGLGLLLANGWFVLCTDRFSPMAVGPCVTAVGESYQLSDVADYWTHEPLG